MNKWLVLFSTLFIVVSCSSSQKDFVVLSGHIANGNADSLRVYSGTYNKGIKLQPDGSFSDTLKVNKGYYRFLVGSTQARLFLKKGFDLQMTADANSYFETVHFEGRGSDENNFLAEKDYFIKNEAMRPREYFALEEPEFYQAIEKMDQRLQAMFQGRTLDSVLVSKERSEDRRWIDYFRGNYDQQHALVSKIQPEDSAPAFRRFERYGGGLISSKNLPVGYHYFMIWSTECDQCRSLFGAFNRLQSEYSGRNINFIGISVDSKQNHQQWEQWVEEYNLSGIQLHTGNGFYRPFIRNFNITKTPRFILVDPDGKIIRTYAPDPSSRELEKLLSDLFKN